MNSAVRRCRPTPGSAKIRPGSTNITDSMARNRKKPRVGSHQMDFVGDSNIGKTLGLLSKVDKGRAGRNFDQQREAREEHSRGYVTSERRSCWSKVPRPSGLLFFSLLAALLVGHRAFGYAPSLR